jgi:thiol-disulfide isomerase/thioredoxin
MKTFHGIFLAACLTAGTGFAEFETWTNRDGNTARMKLIGVSQANDQFIAEFALENGRKVNINAETLSDADAARIRAWQPEKTFDSVFDEILHGQLVSLNGRRFSRHTIDQKPEQYYVFFYTASWCPGCVRIAPDLVKFYEEHRKSTNKFELVLVSSDPDENAMLDFARKMNMPWPHVRFQRIEQIRKQLAHQIPGFPTLIVCDLDGKVLHRFHSLAPLQNTLLN